MEQPSTENCGTKNPLLILAEAADAADAESKRNGESTPAHDQVHIGKSEEMSHSLDKPRPQSSCDSSSEEQPSTENCGTEDPLLMLLAAAEDADSKLNEESTPAHDQVHVGKSEELSNSLDQPRPHSSSDSASEDDAPAQKQAQKHKKWTKKALTEQEVINLEMLKEMSPKTMTDLFSESVPSSNQYETRVTYECKLFLEPGVCDHRISCNRNEEYAKRQMERHLVEHRNRLIKTGSSSFKTCSIQFRKKQAETIKRNLASFPREPSKRTSRFSSLKSKLLQVGVSLGNQQSNHSEKSSKATKKKIVKAKKGKADLPTLLVTKQDKIENKPTNSIADRNRAGPSQRKKKRDLHVAETSSSADSKEEAEEEFYSSEPKEYPVHDHDYAVPHGTKPKVLTLRRQSSGCEAESDDDASISNGVSLESTASKDMARGIHLYDEGQATTPMVCREEIFEEPVAEVFPALKSTRRGQVFVPKEENDHAENPDLKAVMNKQRRPAFPRTKDKPIPDEEKRLALEYIKELSQRQKGKKIQKQCKICRDGKTFTAVSTLKCHYKSHAGIKAFQCSECKKRFTRKCSLNYHKHVHRNEYRFVCKDCGWPFLHRSHYKEHKRKHTGETPFQCEDCPMKFQKRSKHKRHLKSEHGKLWTAKGITLMSPEELAKVRTKRDKKIKKSSRSHKNSGLQEQMPGPSDNPPVSATVDQKPVRRMKTSTATRSSGIPLPPVSVAVVTPSVATVTLPLVSTIQLPFSHSQGNAAAMNVASHSADNHTNASPAIGTVSQPSVGVIPPIGAMQQANPGVGMLGMTTVANTRIPVSPSPGLPTPTQMAMTVGQAVNMGMGQPAISLPGQLRSTTPSLPSLLVSPWTPDQLILQRHVINGKKLMHF